LLNTVASKSLGFYVLQNKLAGAYNI